MRTKKSFNLLLLSIAVSLSVAPLLLRPGADFPGSDNLASRAIAELCPGYEPWFRKIWEPPSSEIEGLLFALQAAIGAGFMGYFIGSRKKSETKREHDSC